MGKHRVTSLIRVTYKCRGVPCILIVSYDQYEYGIGIFHCQRCDMDHSFSDVKFSKFWIWNDEYYGQLNE